MQAVVLGVRPNRRQQEIRNHIGQRAVSQNVIGRRANPVGKPGAAEEGEGGVDLAGQQQKDEDPAEAASADRPLLDIHGPAASRRDAQPECAQRPDSQQDQCGDHGVGSCLFAGSSR